MNITDYANKGFDNAVNHGFHDDNLTEEKQEIALMMLTIIELSNIAEEIRHDDGTIESMDLEHQFRYYKELFNDLDDEHRQLLTKVMLVVTELGEVGKAILSGNFYNKDGVGEEIADTLIRLFDFAGLLKVEYGIDIEKEINRKMEYNKSRPYKHGKSC